MVQYASISSDVFALIAFVAITLYFFGKRSWIEKLFPGLIQNLRFRSLPDLKQEYKPFLVQNFPFYLRLNDLDKTLFEKRVQKFISSKEFIPRGGIEVITAEMKVLTAGSAIQLTFGYPEVYFRHFEKILMYPDDYYSRITRQYHKGEVNLGGLIVLSWKNLKEGFLSSSDGIHLGFHEMAHALRLINIIDNSEYDFCDQEIMEAFDQEATKEIKKMMEEADSQSIFRDYATANLHEFFAIAVEVFFERSDEFATYNHTLFTLLSQILRVDPRSGRRPE